jgi:tRNA modification GTPase
VSDGPTDRTLAALLTPPGTAAIATLGLCGPRAWQVLRELFAPAGTPGRQLPVEPRLGPFWYGRLGEDPRGTAADEVVVAVRRTDPLPRIEINCHGGREVVRYLLELLEARGVHVCPWQELERHGEADPGRAAALAALVEAKTVRTAAVLLDQYHGALARAVDAVRAALAGGRVEEAGSRLRALLRFAPVGRHLTRPWAVTVAGAPNVGKSSLVNALAGYPRCVVAATPGTTRDVVTTLIAVDGWPVELADTAGLRTGAAGLERLGMERAERAARGADLCLWVLDGSAAPVWPAETFPRLRFVVNKIDLPAAPGFAAPAGAAAVSARTGAGLEDLCRKLADWLVPDPPLPGAPVPFTAALCERLEEAHACCSAGRAGRAAELLEKTWD